MKVQLTGTQQDLLRQLMQEYQKDLLTPEQSADMESIRAAHIAELESYTPGADFKVRISSSPNGATEFYFPPAPFETHAPGVSLGFLFMFCILWVISGPLFSNFRPGSLLVMPFYVGWALITLVLFIRVLRLWFFPDRVTIANGVFSKTVGVFRRTRSMPVADITAIHAVPGSIKTHGAIRIVGRRLFTVGDGIHNLRDAEWLAMQMSRAAGVKPSASLPIDYGSEQLEMIQAVLKNFATARDTKGLS